MFEDSLVESTGRIRTGSRWFTVGSFAFQAAVLAVLILIPILYPAALPKQALSTLLVAPPPPPAAPVQMPQAPAAHAPAPVQLSGLVAPTTIPRHIPEGDRATSAPPNVDNGIERAGQVPGAIPLLGNTPPAPLVVTRPKPTGPVRVSAGVAQGHILEPMRPVYPAVAKAAHIQGTVAIEAVISKDGVVKGVHVISGPPLLVQAAVEAVNRARYVPFKLNGEPVEVDTAINIVFTLGD